MNKYSPSEFIKNAYSLMFTKLFFPKARLIRRPLYLRGRHSLSGCNRLTTGRFCRFDLIGSKRTVFIGDNCEMGDMTHIVGFDSVTIGNNVLIASKCFVSDTNHGIYTMEQQSAPYTVPRERPLATKPVHIGNNVWIGENAVILAGADIGDGCIIGANTVVNTKIPAGSIVVGHNRIIKQWDDESQTWKSF